jgi:hypothetical protein
MKPEVSKPDLANNWFIQIYFDANSRKFTLEASKVRMSTLIGLPTAVASARSKLSL